jgi:hypothetical protein
MARKSGSAYFSIEKHRELNPIKAAYAVLAGQAVAGSLHIPVRKDQRWIRNQITIDELKERKEAKPPRAKP